MTDKERFKEIVGKYVKRIGIDKLMDVLEKSDFYTAPASTRFHDSAEGGLCHHSLKVFDNLVIENETLPKEKRFDMETIAIVSLFHDLCKIFYYTTEMRNTKDERGNWTKVPFYTVKDQYPFGHSEKSVDMVRDFLELTVEERLAIRWHMGGFDESVRGGSFAISDAYNYSNLPVLLHVADLKATYIK